jgi:hypothetical protein
MGSALEGLSGTVKKAASDLLGKQPNAHPSNGVATAGSGRALPSTSIATESAPSESPACSLACDLYPGGAVAMVGSAVWSKFLRWDSAGRG